MALLTCLETGLETDAEEKGDGTQCARAGLSKHLTTGCGHYDV